MGRPRKYPEAQSLAEAMHALEQGCAPAKPRNIFERVAAAKRAGRRIDPGSRTRLALDLVRYYLREGLSVRKAANRAVAELAAATAAPPLNPDNIRKLVAVKTVRVYRPINGVRMPFNVPFVEAVGVSGEIDTPGE
jgi:hypothetical protein